MSLSAPKTLFGIHSATFYNRVSKIPYGILKCLGGSELALSGSFTDLNGGSSRFAWDSEAGILDCSLNLNVKEFSNILFERALGASVTASVSAEASGNVGTLTDYKGTLVNGTTGIATATLTSGAAADLKSGLYVVEATGAKKVKVYALSDADFVRGTRKSFVDDSMIIVSEITFADTSDAQVIAGFGITLTGGSGTVALTTGDTAIFYVRPVNGGNDIITVGADTSEFAAFGCFLHAQRKADGSLFEIDCPNVKAIGLPLSLQEMAWSTAQISGKVIYDADENCVFKARRIKAA